VAGSIDTLNRNVYVSIKDNAGNVTTVGDTTNAKVDNIAPTVTSGPIQYSLLRIMTFPLSLPLIGRSFSEASAQ
jgi:hypothetical protein